MTPKVRPVTGALGAVITGIALGRELNYEQVAVITAALHHHLVCLFPNQHLSPAQLVAFAGNFGTVNHTSARNTAGVPEVMVRDSRRTPPDHVDEWHADGTYTTDPPALTVLHAQQVPEVGGDTLWADTSRAYRALSPVMQRFLAELTAVHVDSRSQRTARHPVVLTHPETGRRALDVNPLYTKGICELEPSESNALLTLLFAHTQRPELTCRHRWSRFDLALWDNRCTLHRPVTDYNPTTTPRLMHRLTIATPQLPTSPSPARPTATIRTADGQPLDRDEFTRTLEQRIEANRDHARQPLLTADEVAVNAQLLDELAGIYDREPLGRFARDLVVSLADRLAPQNPLQRSGPA